MGRTRIKIKLSGEEEKTLHMWVGAGKTEQRMARRAKVILCSAKGLTLPDVSEKSGISKQNCSKWRKRFSEARLDGLKDMKGRGRPRVITPQQRLDVIALASGKPPDGSSRWSVRKLAKATGLGVGTTHKILNEGEIKPHKVECWCGRSPDPGFAQRQAAILGLYLNPPDNALVLSVDEKSRIQALDRTEPELPMKPGKPRRQAAIYTPHGTTCLLASLWVHEGVVDSRCIDRHTHKEFLAFLKHLYRKNPGKHLHIILDNFSAHKHHAVKQWASKRRRLTFHFTPTYASWLNQIEIWFNIFTKDVIKGGVWRSKQELVNQIMGYIKQYNQTRVAPFRWTYTGKPLVA